MLKIIWCISIILLCGYLVIEWFPITTPFHFSAILIGPIIYPLDFFAASLAFFFGLVFTTQLFQAINKLTKRDGKKKRGKL